MSVSVYRTVHYIQHELGRAEAHWLYNHADTDGDSGSAILICKDRVDEYMKSARECEAGGCGCEGFKVEGDNNEDHWGSTVEEHREITLKMPSLFNALFADAMDDMVTLEVSW